MYYIIYLIKLNKIEVVVIVLENKTRIIFFLLLYKGDFLYRILYQTKK